ncbi:MAG TPA: DUF6599 family protein [Chthonomonadaceae bacterium]|nr:DUF6599 family protein [Chthonomonadaceae bacterium]
MCIHAYQPIARLLPLLALLLFLMAGQPANAQGDLGALFPASNAVAGWTLKEAPKFFSDNQLFDYMDGAAEIPKSYAFRQLGSAKYQNGVNVLEVAIFDMGTSADAFGYYSARCFLEHNPRVKETIIALDHPANLYVAVGVLTLWKDHYTILIQPDIGKPDEKTLTQFARIVSAKIREKGSPPEMLRRLPSANRVPNSERYVRGKAGFDALLAFIPTDVFGASKKPETVAAEYNLPGRVATLFLIHYPTASAAGDAFNAYKQYLTTKQAVFAASGVPNSFTALAKKERGTAAATSGSYLGVVLGANDAKTAATALRSLLTALSK